MSLAVYEVCIDWDNDGDYLDAGEDVSGDVKFPISWERGFEDQLGASQAATLEMHLVDITAKYSPENAGSSLYPNVEVGRRVRLRAFHDSTWYELFHGRINSIVPHPHPTERTVYLYCIDELSWLATVDITTELYIQKTENYIINDILDNIGWGAGAAYRDIDDSVETLYGTTLFGLWWHHIPALQAIREFEAITRGRFFITHEGKARWQDRLYRSGLASAHTFNDDMISLTYERAMDGVYNHIIGNAQSEFYTGKYAESLVASWSIKGSLAVAANVVPVAIIPRGGLKGWKVRGHLKTPPIGGDVIIDINYDGTTIFTDQSHRLIIYDGDQNGETRYLDVDTYEDNKLLTVDIDQIGSTTAGLGLTLEFIAKAPIYGG